VTSELLERVERGNDVLIVVEDGDVHSLSSVNGER
jgi:antitoxin (DNA-binding transcriptional repressor) of toxin-antitoxin stability system